MTKFLAPAAIVLALLSAAPSARAQAFGQLGSADVLPVNGRLFGGYVHASENIIGLLAQLRLSFYPDIDFGFQGGLTRIDLAGSDITTVRVGGDVKFQVAKVTDTFPVDVSLGGALGVEAGDDISILSLGPTVAASRRLGLAGSSDLVPYASIGLLFTRTDIGDFDDSSIVVPLRFGSELRFSEEFRVLFELQVPINDDYNDNLGLVTGVNLPF